MVTKSDDRHGVTSIATVTTVNEVCVEFWFGAFARCQLFRLLKCLAQFFQKQFGLLAISLLSLWSGGFSQAGIQNYCCSSYQGHDLLNKFSDLLGVVDRSLGRTGPSLHGSFNSTTLTSGPLFDLFAQRSIALAFLQSWFEWCYKSFAPHKHNRSLVFQKWRAFAPISRRIWIDMSSWWSGTRIAECFIEFLVVGNVYPLSLWREKHGFDLPLLHEWIPIDFPVNIRIVYIMEQRWISNSIM